jgi:hypothetical protein
MIEDTKPLVCPKCGSDKVHRQGKQGGRQMIQCQTCHKYSTLKDDPVTQVLTIVAPASGFINLSQVIEKYDVASAIRRELAALPKGRLILEAELCQKTSGTDRNRFRRTLDNNADGFRAFRILLKLDEGEKKWYWGSISDVEQALKIRDA